ncbi:aryl-alcohol dehydrogenase-like predicted oxidoreductase [Actinoplanes campanulatus]|uniref:Aryl-alcohol dehydrogenase-like predicted oxidoreductase n=1 Tax=Actinoplanes campanulatus TaxID=113559 RepID=A0A7W5AGU6_9ACTN|nr:aryl-alcohol dehydrogenase-like predicted oxidoreductase [Actinoplanes campanulatus]GGN11633.1 hypothetical protein GCM10010109_21800 [Actinoplanes campanulatus]GID36696.1 hypothetical protein Aca09nite_32020 [Actinoplanes campanulatus]
MYGWGDGEKLLGTALARSATRSPSPPSSASSPTPPRCSAPTPAPWIRKVVDDSLRNLGVDYIDVLYQHMDDPNVSVEDVVGVMKEYVDAGKVKYLGLSNTTPDNVRRAHAVHPIAVLQTEYSIFARRSEAFFPVLEELGIGLVAYSPLARGFLSGAVKPRDQHAADDFRQYIPWWAPEHFDANVAITAELTKLAEGKGTTLAQLALAWLLEKKDYIVPIPGSRNPERVAQNLAAAEVKLTADDLARIDEIAPNGGVSGYLT